MTNWAAWMKYRIIHGDKHWDLVPSRFSDAVGSMLEAGPHARRTCMRMPASGDADASSGSSARYASGVGSPVQLALRISAGPNWPNVAGMRDWLAVAGRSPHGIEGWAVCDRQLTHRVKTVALI